MTRTRRLTAIATGLALTAAASIGAVTAQADTGPVGALRTDYLACTGLSGAAGVCVEDPATTIDQLPRARQLIHDLTGIG